MPRVPGTSFGTTFSSELTTFPILLERWMIIGWAVHLGQNSDFQKAKNLHSCNVARHMTALHVCGLHILLIEFY